MLDASFFPWPLSCLTLSQGVTQLIILARVSLSLVHISVVQGYLELVILPPSFLKDLGALATTRPSWHEVNTLTTTCGRDEM